MAAGNNKNNKPELIAIYRLEFYKKQKNWKFCQDVCKKPPDEPEKSLEEKAVLNKTYNIETDPDVPEESALNDAFVDTDSDQNPPQTPPTHDITRDWPDGGILPPPQHNPDHIPEPTFTVPVKPWAQWRQDKCWQMPVSEKQIWQEPGQVLYEDGREAYFAEAPVDFDKYASNDFDKGWPAHSQVWTNDPGTTDAVFNEGNAGDMREKYECAPTTVLSEAECWLSHDQTDQLWAFTTKEEISLESARAFMLGAAAAPHSSELDLRSCSVSEADLSGATISSLSTRQLADSVHRHATLLRQLLLEARVREASTFLENSPSYTHQPPSRPLGPTLARSVDTFIAGSHNNVGGIEEGGGGRGRGRLASRRRGVGIGMGRPYWL